MVITTREIGGLVMRLVASVCVLVFVVTFVIVYESAMYALDIHYYYKALTDFKA